MPSLLKSASSRSNSDFWAGVIHTDFERGFIKADTVAYPEFLSNGGWKGAREKGAVRSEGREYVVKDGDVMLFKFNV